MNRTRNFTRFRAFICWYVKHVLTRTHIDSESPAQTGREGEEFGEVMKKTIYYAIKALILYYKKGKEVERAS